MAAPRASTTGRTFESTRVTFERGRSALPSPIPRGSAKSVAGCLMFGVFGVLTGVRRGPAGTIGGV